MLIVVGAIGGRLWAVVVAVVVTKELHGAQLSYEDTGLHLEQWSWTPSLQYWQHIHNIPYIQTLILSFTIHVFVVQAQVTFKAIN